MKNLRLLLCGLPLVLTGCSTLSNVHWSAAAPWNWFGSSLEVTEKGLGDITAETPLTEAAIGDGLGDDYRLRSGMRTEGGAVVRYFEALKDDKLAVTINGENGVVSRIDVLDADIKTDSGVEIGMPFSDLYDKAYGACKKALGDDSDAVECQAPGSHHVSYLFTGEWRGPEGLMPSDDALKKWTLHKIVWRR